MSKRPLAERLEDSEVVDRAADIIERDPLLELIGGGLVAQLRGIAALIRGEPTHERGKV